jgi:hypothetical protein
MKKDTFIMGTFGVIGVLVILMFILAFLIQVKIIGMGYSSLGVMIICACIGAICVSVILKMVKIEGDICPLEDA